MGRWNPRRLGTVAVAAALVSALLTGAGLETAAAADESDYELGYELGLQAYRYGLPLLTTDKTFANQTSIDVSNGRGFGPVNQFNPVRQFITPEDRSVVAPNLDTLYSVAWLDLSREPQIIHVPKVKDRYFVVPLMSPYTENFANLGSVDRTPPGDYAVVGPDDADVVLPKHVTRIESPYDRVWIIERVYADNDSAKDIEKVNKIQDMTSVIPLSEYPRKNWRAPLPANPDTTIDSPGLPTGMTFYDRLGSLLEEFPPPAADQPVLDELARIGVGPGMRPSTDASLTPGTVAGMTAAVAAGPAAVLADAQAMYGQDFARHNGYLVTPTGTYGTDYRLRAVVTQVGLGALRPEQSVYPLALLDRTGQPLTGAKRYVVHVPAGGLPPVTATGFWSLTLYDNDGFIVDNEIDRYAINDRTDLHFNADGSVDLYVQAQRPTDPTQAQNWLPTPAGAYRLLWRTYGTEQGQIAGIFDGSGWQAPAVMPVG
jgi:DNA sulfur modification protein DndE